MKLRDLGIPIKKRYGLVVRISSFRESCNEISLDSIKCHCDRIMDDYNSNLGLIGVSTITDDDDKDLFFRSFIDFIYSHGKVVDKIRYKTGNLKGFTRVCIELSRDGFIEFYRLEDKYDCYIYMNDNTYKLLADIDL